MRRMETLLEACQNLERSEHAADPADTVELLHNIRTPNGPVVIFRATWKGRYSKVYVGSPWSSGDHYEWYHYFTMG